MPMLINSGMEQVSEHYPSTIGETERFSPPQKNIHVYVYPYVYNYTGIHINKYMHTYTQVGSKIFVLF